MEVNMVKMSDIEVLKKIIKMKKENPEEYKVFITGMKEVMSDLADISIETMNKIKQKIE